MDVAAQLRVGIVGGGYAGLAAGVELSAAGIPVTLFEASRVLGGRARRVDSDGRSLDNGQHLLIGAYTETLRLLAMVGADTGRVLKRQRLHLAFSDGFTLRAPPLPAPLHLAVALLTARLSWPERLAALRLMSHLKKIRFRLDGDCLVSEFLDTHAQPDNLRRHLWEPLCVAALNTPPAEASAQVFANVLRDSLAGPRAASDLLLPATDLTALFPDPAARFITARDGEIVAACSIGAIRPSPEGFALHGDTRPRRFSHLVLAVAPHHLPRLIGGLPPLAGLAARVGALRHEPIATAYLAYPQHVRLPAAMLGQVAGHAQWLFDRGRLAGQHGLIAAVISSAGPWQSLSRDVLLSGIHADIQAVAGPLPAPLWTQLIVEKRATFACVPGLVRPPMRTAVAGLLLAGDYVASDYPATIESAVRSGVAAARSIIDEAAVGQAQNPATAPRQGIVMGDEH